MLEEYFLNKLKVVGKFATGLTHGKKNKKRSLSYWDSLRLRGINIHCFRILFYSELLYFRHGSILVGMYCDVCK